MSCSWLPVFSIASLLRLAAYAVLAVTLVTSSPLPPPPGWHDPCNGQTATPGQSAQLPNMAGLLERDARDLNIAANELKSFTLTRISTNFAELLEAMHFDGFPHDYTADTSGSLTAELLRADYKYLSHAAIYYEKMIENEGICSVDGNGIAPMEKVKERVYAMMCHVKQTLGMMGEEVTSFEDKDTVLMKAIKDFAESCSSDDQGRQGGDYVISKDTVHYSAQLIQQYVTIVQNLPAGETTTNSSE